MTETFIVGKNTKIYDTARIIKTNCEIIIGDDCLIGDLSFIAPRKLTMHDRSQIAPCAVLSGGGEVHMGYKSAIGFNANIICATDTPEAQFMVEGADPSERKVVRGSISLGKGAYIGSGATICVSRRCQDIVIGDYSVIGAGCYIDRPIPANRKVIPAKKHIITPRFVCAVDKSRECTLSDCSIHGLNWNNCGYLNKSKAL